MRLAPCDQLRTNQLWRLYRDIDHLIDRAVDEKSLDAERLNQLVRRKSRLEGRITKIWMRSFMGTDFVAMEPEIEPAEIP